MVRASFLVFLYTGSVQKQRCYSTQLKLYSKLKMYLSRLMEVQVAELQWVPAGQLGSAWCLGRELAKPEDQPPLPLSS